MENKTSTKEIKIFLEKINKKNVDLHKKYEDLFWVSYMGDHSVDEKKDKALAERDEFRANREITTKVSEFLKIKNLPDSIRESLRRWKLFFDKYQTPEEVLDIKKKIDILESKINKNISNRKEGYIDPKSRKFVKASKGKMGMIKMVNPDESVRKACFEAMENLAVQEVGDFVKLVTLRNDFSRKLGFVDFYAYKLMSEEGMKKEELFPIFNTIYEKTKYAFKDIRDLEKKMPGLRKPWNFGFMLSGDFVKEEDPYFQFEDGLIRWGKSFSALGIDYAGGNLQLDLLDREGKYNNGFCHYPDLVWKNGNKLEKGSTNFTCNVVAGQIGSGMRGMVTLFHEGGHGADRLNSIQTESCMNMEYPPASTAWAETHSMFLDTLFSSIEWRTRYAKNQKGEPYPFDLFLRKLEKTFSVNPISMMSVIAVMEFERQVYESKDLTEEKVLSISKKVFKKYFDESVDSYWLLGIPHIYSWESSCSYHGYGLAKLSLSQWRKYFYKKYGYIVDNPNVGKEMINVWKLGSTKTFPEMVKIATGKKLSPDAFIENATNSKQKIIKTAKERIERLKKVKEFNKPIDLKAQIKMVHGKEVIADNKKSFEDMSEKYKKWFISKKQ